jgi:hypothetical protein
VTLITLLLDVVDDRRVMIVFEIDAAVGQCWCSGASHADGVAPKGAMYTFTEPVMY